LMAGWEKALPLTIVCAVEKLREADCLILK
jgi:hypothetical protein